MDERTFTLPAPDGEQVFVYCWQGDAPPRAIVQIAHGMGEHAGRYRRFAEALTGAGYVVYANDHRGHGRTAGSPARHGDLGPDGWKGLVADVHRLTGVARGEHPGLPLVLIGHSMGSFALQEYLLDHSADLDGAVLSGTTAVDVIAPAIDPSQPADLTSFNAPFEPARTAYDWLSRDPAEVDLYIADDDCGFGVDAAGTRGMLESASALADPERLAAIAHDLPVLVFSGDADPLAGGGPLVQMVADRYRAAGIEDVTLNLYPGARHETLNETNRDDVTADVIAWLDRVTARA
jgi:alpha-beta hydrolase superfamily lysophospholipase